MYVLLHVCVSVFVSVSVCVFSPSQDTDFTSYRTKLLNYKCVGKLGLH